MIHSENLAYSDDPLSAFVAAIISSYERYVGGRNYLGRTAIQKLVYFVKALGAPIPCSFEIYTYGPYSDSVTVSMDSMLADDVLKDTSSDPKKYSNYRLGADPNEIFDAYQPLIEPYRPVIDAVVQSLGGFKPPELELVATLHFVHHRLKQILRKEPSEDQVLAEFRRVKRDKFAQAEIEGFYDALKRAQLV